MSASLLVSKQARVPGTGRCDGYPRSRVCLPAQEASGHSHTAAQPDQTSTCGEGPRHRGTASSRTPRLSAALWAARRRSVSVVGHSSLLLPRQPGSPQELALPLSGWAVHQPLPTRAGRVPQGSPGPELGAGSRRCGSRMCAQGSRTRCAGGWGWSWCCYPPASDRHQTPNSGCCSRPGIQEGERNWLRHQRESH